LDHLLRCKASKKDNSQGWKKFFLAADATTQDGIILHFNLLLSLSAHHICIIIIICKGSLEMVGPFAGTLMAF